MKCAGRTETGLRSQNEDSYLILNTESVHAVAVSDGMGGHRAGETASATAIAKLEDRLKNVTGDWEAALNRAFRDANTEVHTLAQSDDSMYGMGCTLVAALCDETHFAAANVGDSRLYHFDGSTIRQVTHDHSFVAELVRRNVITPEEAKTHKPTVLFVDQDNHIVRKANYEKHGLLIEQ